jgi:crotonobetainyl-CoA:carnitine CoA-transferase CaiB-like acyl-CoA transferase
MLLADMHGQKKLRRAWCFLRAPRRRLSPVPFWQSMVDTARSCVPARPGIAPELGNHNDAALAELGYNPAEVADLRTRKII